MKKMFRRSLASVLVGAMLVGSCAMSAGAVERVDTTYNKVEEICDWGAATTKVIVDIDQNINSTKIANDAFTVYVKRIDERVKEKPLLEDGNRKVLNAYISDEKGKKEKVGSYVTLELEVGPTISIGSPLNYYDGSNVWIDCEYTITQSKSIKSGNKTVSGLVATTLKNRYVPQIDKFTDGSSTYNDSKFGEITIGYADYKPVKTPATAKKPLIIWLHGGGEGGTDVTIPLSANKSCNFASSEIQDYFDGAFVLVPQAPTKWMDDGSANANAKGTEKTNADSKYTKAVMNLIEEYVKANPGVDSKRIYIGGCSNGGFLTLRLVLDYPKYFAAAFPVCEGINDQYISDEEIEKIKNMPIWFTTAATDTTIPAPKFTLSTYDRLIKAGAKNVHLSYFVNIIDKTGLYKNDKGMPHEYNGHWSWTYVYDNRPELEINGKNISIMEWMADQKR